MIGILKKRIVVVILMFVLFGLLPLVLFRLLAYPKASAELKHGVKNNLQSLLNKQKDMLMLLRYERESHARAIADSILSTLLIYGNETFDNLMKGSNEREYLRLETLMECTKVDYGYRGIFICDSSGIILAATETEMNMVGKNILKEKGFLSIQKTVYDGKTSVSDVMHYGVKDDEDDAIPSLFLSYPIKGENHNVLGAIVLWMDVTILNQVMTNFVLGRTGEAYLVNKDGVMVTQSRFSEHIKSSGDTCKTCHVVSDPDSQMLTKGVKRCITEKSQGFDLEGYRDYDGFQVVGAWSWLKDFNMGLMVEIDADEAFSALQNINSMTKSLMIAILIPAFAMAILTYRKFSTGYMLKNLAVPYKALLGVTIIITLGFVIAVLDGYELRKERGYLREQKYKVRNPFNTLGSLIAQRDENFIMSTITAFKKNLPVFKLEDAMHPENNGKEGVEGNASQSQEQSIMAWELKQ